MSCKYKYKGVSYSREDLITELLKDNKVIEQLNNNLDINLQNASKVVDGNGMPLLVHHGTSIKFNEFEIRSEYVVDSMIGSHFAEDLQVAKNIVKDKFGRGELQHVFLNIKTPKSFLNINEKDGEYDGDIIRNFVFKSVFQKNKNLFEEFKKIAVGVSENDTVEQSVDYYDFFDSAQKTEFRKLQKEIVQFYNSNQNEDGIIYKNTDPTETDGSGSVKSFITFSPNQIKSATENIGTFSNESNDIRFSQGQQNSPKKIEAELLDQLKKTGLANNVFQLSSSEISTKLEELGQENVKNTTRGFVTASGDIYLNSDVATNETLLHEYNHLYNSWLKKNRPDLYKKGISLIEQEMEKGSDSDISSVISFVRRNQPSLEGEDLKEEILTQILGEEGSKLLEELKNKSDGGIIDWIKSVWAEIGKMLGLTNMTPQQAVNLSLAEYAKAVNVDILLGREVFKKDTDNIYKIAEESYDFENFVDKSSFRDAHTAPSKETNSVEERRDEGGDFSLREVAKGFHNQPEDYFDKNVGARYYGYDNAQGKQSFTAVDNIIRGLKAGKKDLKITAYRAKPKSVNISELKDYDWVTFSKDYAVSHGENRFGENKYDIIEQEVSIDDLWWDGNDINEWGYDTGNTKNYSRRELKEIWDNVQNQKITFSQQTVARKYKELYSLLQKERGEENVEVVTDKNGFDWYETKITPGEVNNPVVAFQKAIEPNLSFETPKGETFDNYSDAIKNTDEGNIKLNIDEINIAEVNSDTDVDTFNGAINHLVKQGGLTGERALQPNGDIVFITQGQSETMKQFTANFVETQASKLLGGSSVKRLASGDFVIVDNLNKITINGEQFDSKEIDSLDYNELKAKFGEIEALNLEIAREYAKSLQPTKTSKRIDTLPEVKEEDELVMAIKSLLNKLGIKITSIEDYIKNNTLKNGDVSPDANALMDIVNKIMAFRNGEITRDDLIEETMHLIEASLDPTLTEAVRRNINKTQEWAEFSEYYFQLYSKEYSGEKLDEMVRREILGKVMANAVKNNFALRENATLTEQSVYGKIKELLQQFFNKIQAYLRPEYINQIQQLNDDIYNKLISGTIVNDMNLDQNYGTKFRLYSASKNQTDSLVQLQKQAESALATLRKDKNSKTSLLRGVDTLLTDASKKIANGEEMQARIALVGAFSKLASMAKNQLIYLERASKKASATQHPFSAEEQIVYTNLIQDFGDVILPSVFNTVSNQKQQLPQEKKLAQEIDKIQAGINKLKGDVKNSGFDARQFVVKSLVERLGLSKDKEEYLTNQVNANHIEANWFMMNFGNLSHSSNPFLNALGHVITKTTWAKREYFQGDLKPFVAEMASKGALGDTSRFVDGAYLEHIHDMKSLEKLQDEEKNRLYKKYLEESQKELEAKANKSQEDNEKLAAINKVLTDFQPVENIYEYEGLDEYSRVRLRREYDTWLTEKVGLKYFNSTFMEKREKALEWEENGVPFSISESTRVYLAEYSARYRDIIEDMEEVNGKKVNTTETKYDTKMLKKEKTYNKFAYTTEGNPKKGLIPSQEGVVGAVKFGNRYYTLDRSLSQIDSADAILAWELNKIDNERFDEIKGQVKAGLTDSFKDIFKTLSGEEALEFLSLNAYLGNTQEYYDSFKSNSNLVDKLEKAKDGDNDFEIDDTIQKIKERQEKMSNILKANKRMNNPSEVEFDLMEKAETDAVRDLQKELEGLYTTARGFLSKEQVEEQERLEISEVTYNKAFFDYLTDTVFGGVGGATTDFSGLTKLDNDARTKIDLILNTVRKHTTENKETEILNLKRSIANIASKKVTKLTKGQQKVYSLTEEEIATMSSDEIEAILMNDVLQYSFTKLLPYFRKNTPKGVNDILDYLESGMLTSEQFLANYELAVDIREGKASGNIPQGYEFLEINPNYSFQEATQDNNINPHFEFAKQNNTPLYRVFEDAVTEQDLRTKSVQQLKKEGLLNAFTNEAYLEKYNIDLVKLFQTGVEEARSNTEDFKVRQSFIDLQKKTLDKTGDLGRHNLYLKPQKGKSTANKVFDFKEKKGGIRSLIDELSIFREEEMELGEKREGVVQASMNNLTIPKFGMRRLRNEPVTDDLLDSYIWMNYKANEHKARKENYQDAFNIGIAAFGDDFGVKISSEAGNNYKMFKEAFDYNYLGVKETWSWEFTNPITGKKNDLAKVLQNFGLWIRFRNLALTVISPITSMTTGMVFKTLERWVGENIDSDADKAANKFFRQHASGAMKEVLSLESKNPLNSLGELFGWYDPMERYNNSQYSKALRGFGKMFFGAHQMANFPVNTRVGLSVLANNKFYEGEMMEYRDFKNKFPTKTEKEIREIWRKQVSVLDVAETDDQGKTTFNAQKIATALNNNFTEEEVKNFMKNRNVLLQGRVKAAIQKVDGAISDEDKSMSARNAFFSFVNIHRSWLMIAVQNKIKSRHLNLQTRYYEEGNWRTSVGYLTDVLKESKKTRFKDAIANFKKVYQNSDEETKRNLKRTLIEAGMFNLFILLAVGVMKELDDDDEDSWAFQVSAMFLLRTTNEVASSTFALHKNVGETLNNVIVGIDAIDIATTAPDLFSDKVMKSGRYAGLTEAEKYWYKQVPGVREYNNLFRDTEGNIKSYRFFNLSKGGNLDSVFSAMYYIEEDKKEK